MNGVEGKKEVYYREYQGQYPAIYLNARDVSKINNFEEFNARLRLEIKNIFLDDSIKQLKAYYNGKNVAEATLCESINFLSKKLREYYNKTVIILIDKFDKPITSLISTIIGKICNLNTLRETKDYLLKVANTMCNIISPLIKSSPGEKECQVVLTGIFNILNKELSASVKKWE